MSSYRGPFPAKRCPPLRSGGRYPKKSAPFTLARSNSGMEGQDDGEYTRDLKISSYRGTFPVKRCPPLRSGGPYTKKHYAYRDHARSREDKHSTRGYSDHDGYRRHGGRDHSEHHSRRSNRASYRTYSTSHGSAPAQRPWKTYGGSSCPDHNNTRDRYCRSRERYSRSHGDFCSSDGQHCGRKEPMCPPSVDRVNRTSREAHGSSRYRTFTGDDGGRRCEKGD
ncbi:RNA-binding motif protein, Y chromosome, family 1 member B-like [Cebus imitator]|uniref:RNA-binding motif protein, Y chromosome, family 1 member B-like n=1 Tax=Cebus imitator TaxID=2715852 RepID=UPI001899F86A|nr:RNA-binding motif protein, Y chromosome, family 1 member B-like [Cebus imitator]